MNRLDFDIDDKNKSNIVNDVRACEGEPIPRASTGKDK